MYLAAYQRERESICYYWDGWNYPEKAQNEKRNVYFE